MDGKKVVMPEDLQYSASILDTIRDSNNIDVYRVEGYFNKVEWGKALILLTKKEKMQWYCSTCHKLIVKKERIICERCLLWCQLSCTNLKKDAKTKKLVLS